MEIRLERRERDYRERKLSDKELRGGGGEGRRRIKFGGTRRENNVI